MSERISTGLIQVLDAQDATGAGTAVDVRDFRHIMAFLASDNSANLTVKCQGGLGSSEPTWTSAPSTTNFWSFIAMYDYEDPTSVFDGDTGIVLTGTDDQALYIINVDGLDYVNFRVTARSAGDVSVWIKGYTNK